MTSRGWGDDIIGGISDKINDLTTIDKDVKFSAPIDWNLPSTLSPEKVGSGLEVSVGCDDCKVTAKLSIAGKFTGVISKAEITESWIQINPEAGGLDVDFNPTLSVSGNLTKPWDNSWELTTLHPTPFSIPKLFSLGPQIVFRAGFEFSGIEGSANIKSGISAKISNQAMAKMDFVGNDGKFDGWVPTVTTKPVNVDAQVQGTLEIFTEVGAEFAISVLKWNMGAGVEMRVPKLTMTLGAEFNSEGNVCPNKPEMFGLKFDASLDASISFAGWKTDRDDPFFNKPVFDKELKKLATDCIVFKDGPKVPIDMEHSTSAEKDTTSTPVSRTNSSAKTTSTSATAISSTSIPTFVTSKKPGTGTGGNLFPTSTEKSNLSSKPYPAGVFPLPSVRPSGWAPSGQVSSVETQPTNIAYKARKVRYLNPEAWYER